MLLGRIFRGHTYGGPPYLDMRVPEWHSCKNLAGYSLSVSSRRGYSGHGIVDTKTIWFVFLLILSCWRVFFLGSPALHNAGADRLQMVGVRSLQVDGSWLLVSSFFFLLEWSAVFYPRQFLKYVLTGIESYAAHCSSNNCFVYDENVNKIDFIVLYCIVRPVLE